jgi:hypothetical protein
MVFSFRRFSLPTYSISAVAFALDTKYKFHSTTLIRHLPGSSTLGARDVTVSTACDLVRLKSSFAIGILPYWRTPIIKEIKER